MESTAPRAFDDNGSPSITTAQGKLAVNYIYAYLSITFGLPL